MFFPSEFGPEAETEAEEVGKIPGDRKDPIPVGFWAKRDIRGKIGPEDPDTDGCLKEVKRPVRRDPVKGKDVLTVN